MAYSTMLYDPYIDPEPPRYDPYEWERNPKFLGRTYRQRLADEITGEWGLDLFDALKQEDPKRFSDRGEFVDIYGSELQEYLD